MNATHHTIQARSPQRRRLLMAAVGGGASTAVPMLALANLSDKSRVDNAGGWILSGQVLHGAKREALAGARVEVWAPTGSIDSIHTDANGRFALTISRREVRPENLGTLKYWVSHRNQGSFVASLGNVTAVGSAHSGGSVGPVGSIGSGLTTVHSDAAGRLLAQVGITLA